MKSIFKRVLVGVLVALILSFIRGNLLIGVSAMGLTTQDVTDASHRYNDNVTSINLINRSLFGINFRGADYGSYTGRVTYNSSNSLDTSKNYDVSFFVYQSNTGQRGNVPVVTYNDNMCSVVPFGTLVTYNETTNLPMFDNFGGWAAPGAVTGNGIQSFNDYLKLHPDLNYTSHGYFVYCSDVNIVSVNKTKVYTAQSWGCGESTCFYGLGTDFYYKQSKDSILIDNQNSNTEKITDEQKKTTQSIDNVNNSINNDNVSSDTGTGFFDDFQVDNHNGISGIVTAPLRLINSLSSSSCSSLSLPLPFVSQNAVLPCMSGIYQQHFSSFLSIYRIITTGLIGYWVLIKLFGHIKGMQSPNDDRIEVFDL